MLIFTKNAGFSDICLSELGGGKVNGVFSKPPLV